MKNLINRLLAYRDRHNAAFFFNEILNFARRYAKIVGLDIFEPDYKSTNFIYIWSVTWICVFIIINFYTITLRVRDGFVVMLICATTLGMAVQGLPKMYLFGSNHKDLVSKCDETLIFYGNFQRAEIKLVARNFAFGCWIFYVYILHIAYLSAIMIAFTVPIASTWYFQGTISLPFDIQLPYIETSGVGFYLHLAYLVVSAIMEFVGLLCGDAFYSILLLNAFTQLENLFVELSVLNELIGKIDSNNASKKKVSEQFQSVLKLHQDYIEFISFVVDKFELYFTANVGTMVFQVVCCLYIVFYDHFWIIGYILILTATIQLLFTCAMGTFLDIKHDELYLHLTEISWFNMDIKDQKQYVIMLAASQRYHYLEYIFGRLDLQVFVEIYKKIYSAFTMLVNTAD